MKKIIISSIAICFVLFIAIATLVMGLISVNANDAIKKPNEIYIYNSSTNYLANKRLELKERNESDKVIINRIFYLFNESFSQKALKALFSNEINTKIETEYTLISETMTKNYSSDDKATIVFYYKNGIEVKKDDFSLTYNYAFFQISNNEERNEIIIGLNENISSDDNSIATISYKFSFVGNCNMKDLYNYIFSLI